MMYQQGCSVGGTVLRLAKNLAENNKSAKVLVVCYEITAIMFRGPSEIHLDSLVGQALFGDGTTAVIVGANPDLTVERPVFELVLAAQTILPDFDGTINGHLREVRLMCHLLKDACEIILKDIKKSLAKAFAPIGTRDWNSRFWIAHPSTPTILDQVEEKLRLKPEKLRSTQHVLSKYRNMSSASILFILNEMRKRSKEEKEDTTGEGFEWACCLGCLVLVIREEQRQMKTKQQKHRT
ncbi:hypothetical protein Fmac_001727 [Flemingia macrophylla]|uniref:chalcone synthase n=1 Tax=Flemingia macrophylla TaxID=520843 RepID=A0ABD1NHX1_9FABA